jgi:hypothetical protein
MSDERPQHVTISTMPSVPPLSGVITVGPPPKRRHPWRIAIAVLVTVAAIGAAVFAVVSWRSEPGGAATPDDAVAQFLTAVAAEDVLGALDVVLPDERATLREPLLELVAELQRLDALDEATDLSAVTGLDIVIDDLTTTTDQVTDDIANVTVSGSFSVSADLRSLPFGTLLTELFDEIDLADPVLSSGTRDMGGLRITTVQQGGRWYVSLTYSIAESLRQGAGADPVPLDAAVRPFGSSSPEAAVDQVLLALETLDLERLIAVLDPREAAALQRYAPIFLDQAQAELDELPLRLTIEDVAYDVVVSGDRATVVVTQMNVDGELDGDPFTVQMAGGCTSFDVAGERGELCAGVEASFDRTASGQLDEELEQLLSDLGGALSGFEQMGITVTKVGGSWYVSPIASGADALLSVLRAVDRDDLDLLLDGFSTSLEEVFVPVEPSRLGGFYDCLADVSDPMVVIACVEEGIESGRFDAEAVPVELRHPDCGLVEPYLYGYGDFTDEEFMAIVEAAHECFGILAFAGVVDPFEIPYEARDPACFFGVNPFGLGDFRETDRVLSDVNACLVDR